MCGQQSTMDYCRCVLSNIRNEKCVYIPTNKTTSFYDCKNCKTCCHVLKIPFKDQKPSTMPFGGDGTHCFARKTSRDYEKEEPSPFSKKFFHQSQSSTSELEPKKGRSYSIYRIIVSTPHWLIQLLRTSFTFSFYTISVYFKTKCFSPTTGLSGLSTSDQIL